MGALDVLATERVRAWEAEIREAACKSSLLWRPYVQAQYEREGRTMRTLSEMPQGSMVWIEFCQGAYDNWCARLMRQDQDSKYYMAFPTDEYYFSRLGLLAIKYGCEKVYTDLRILYAMTTNAVSNDVVDVINMMAMQYDVDEDVAYNMFMHVYYGMVAEEHYSRTISPAVPAKRTKMGKLMKVHAIHRFLIEKHDVYDVSRECVGMKPEQVISQAQAMGLSRDVTWTPYDSPYDEPDKQPIVEQGAKKRI